MMIKKSNKNQPVFYRKISSLKGRRPTAELLKRWVRDPLQPNTANLVQAEMDTSAKAKPASKAKNKPVSKRKAR